MAASRFGNFRFTWVRPPSIIAARLAEIGSGMDAKLLSEMSGVASDIEAWMKANHPWQNRTRDAERGLQATASITAAHNVSIVAKHGVPYGGFLETGTSHNAPYPVLAPGLQAHYHNVQDVMQRVAHFEGL